MLIVAMWISSEVGGEKTAVASVGEKFTLGPPMFPSSKIPAELSSCTGSPVFVYAGGTYTTDDTEDTNLYDEGMPFVALGGSSGFSIFAEVAWNTNTSFEEHLTEGTIFFLGVDREWTRDSLAFRQDRRSSGARLDLIDENGYVWQNWLSDDFWFPTGVPGETFSLLVTLRGDDDTFEVYQNGRLLSKGALASPFRSVKRTYFGVGIDFAGSVRNIVVWNGEVDCYASRSEAREI
ncbi:hypothetical protein CYMTET_31823 [Cymbomonas tetramitiformis]|uniref:Uncharacterized protein n=1 Tax=Cymbomonas tetramitiformis TaxID=36881 RepID=A0AAE0FGA1_9CHLO|nr:hypothetical protein CYMTET_31823 [Cymbomonas tetramitiformis]